MIRTVADLLEALIQRERESLPKYSEIQHTGIFGTMYENLTQDVLGRALFKGTDLRVVRGKIRNSKGVLSRQIDCMIVVGDGEKIPYTEELFYSTEKVVMIVEVKKTLYGADLLDAFNLFHHYWAEVAEIGKQQCGLMEAV